MRKIDCLANEFYGGDIKKAIYEIVNGEERDINDYITELGDDETCYALCCLEEKAIKKAGGKENYINDLKMKHMLNSLELSEEEILSMEANPYKSKLKKLGLIALIGLVLVLLAFIINKFIGIVTNVEIFLVFIVFVYIVLLNTVPNVLSYRKHEKAKKLVQAKHSRVNNGEK